mmetsp:Transcript_48787/g.154578  ORF Transcript_48787/g.154578 Transcript_48787/m.154578 type:complete len:296 (-) Transcript_48787:873-1760(-)
MCDASSMYLRLGPAARSTRTTSACLPATARHKALDSTAAPRLSSSDATSALPFSHASASSVIVSSATGTDTLTSRPASRYISTKEGGAPACVNSMAERKRTNPCSRQKPASRKARSTSDGFGLDGEIGPSWILPSVMRSTRIKAASTTSYFTSHSGSRSRRTRAGRRSTAAAFSASKSTTAPRCRRSLAMAGWSAKHAWYSSVRPSVSCGALTSRPASRNPSTASTSPSRTISCSSSSNTSLCLTSPGGAWVKQGSAMTGCRGLGGPGCGGGEAVTLVSLVVFAASRAFSLASAS